MEVYVRRGVHYAFQATNLILMVLSCSDLDHTKTFLSWGCRELIMLPVGSDGLVVRSSCSVQGHFIEASRSDTGLPYAFPWHWTSPAGHGINPIVQWLESMCRSPKVSMI